jgi:hypothetical protein
MLGLPSILDWLLPAALVAEESEVSDEATPCKGPNPATPAAAAAALMKLRLSIFSLSSLMV